MEAVQNATKHADATRIDVELRETTEGLTLTVADDGKGLTTDVATGTGTGTSSMRDRLRAVGGTLEIRSRPGHGTTVIARVAAHVPAAAAEV